MRRWFGKETDVAGYVTDQLPYLEPDCPWIMTITRGKSGAYSVRFVTDTSSEGTEHQTVLDFSDPPQSILKDHTRDG